MDQVFAAHVEALRPTFERLLAMPVVTAETLPPLMCRAGIYLFSEAKRDLYVGRSRNIRRRIRRHCSPGATYKSAAFAFKLAREETGMLQPAYAAGPLSRAGLMDDPKFAAAFKSAKGRIRKMSLRFVEEPEPTRQALLEIYASVVLQTPYNDFDTH